MAYDLPSICHLPSTSTLLYFACNDELYCVIHYTCNVAYAQGEKVYIIYMRLLDYLYYYCC